MAQLILDIEKESDLDLLLPFLKQHGIKYIPTMGGKDKLTEKEKQAAINRIQKGVTDSYFNNVDALDWQKEQRKDRDLPYFDK